MISHSAPPVVYPLGRSHVHGLVLLCVWLAGVLLVASWGVLKPQLDWRTSTCLLVLAVSGAAAFISWKNAASGQIVWDGQLWRWESAAYQAGVAEQQVSVMADFQHVMLLRIENKAKARLWVWAERKCMPERWLDLRRALFFPHRQTAAVVSDRSNIAASGDT